MENELFCVVCESKKEDMTEPVVYNGICPKCGNSTLYVKDLTRWVCFEKSNGKNAIFVISHAPRCIPDTWVDIYEGEKQYEKLVSVLTCQKDVKIIENDESGTLKYIRNGHQFQIMLISYVDYLTSAYDLWDGNPYIEFALVKKDHPDFEIYKDELKRVCDILD